MAFIKIIREEDATGGIREEYEAARLRAGRVANIIKVMSLDAATLRSSMRFYGSLMKSKNALDAGRREMLATVVSNANGCFY